MATSASSTEPTNATIPIPPSLTATSQTLPSASSQALISHLRAINAVPELSSILSDSLARTGWTDRVRALALELLRNGTCDTFPELITEVMRRAKLPREGTTGGGSKSQADKESKKEANGANVNGGGAGGVNGNNAIALSKEWSGGPDGLPDVHIPEVTVELGVEFLRERIKDVVEPVDEDTD